MKRFSFLLSIFYLILTPLLGSDIQEIFRRPYEIITGTLASPQENVLWNAEEDGIANWSVAGPGTLSLDERYCLWNDHSARLEFSEPGRVTLSPIHAIILRKPAYGVSYWIVCTDSGKTTNLLQIQDATGKKYTLRTRNNSSFWAQHPWWCTSSFAIPSQAVFPIAITELVFETGNDIKPGDAIHFDFLQSFQVNPVKYPQDLLATTGDYITTPGTILPTPPQKAFQNHLVPGQDGFRFQYEGEDGTLQFLYSPTTGTLEDVSASFDGKAPFLPMAGGGIRARRNGVTFSPGDPEIQCRLLGVNVRDNVLFTRWQWAKNNTLLEFGYSFAIRGRTLVVTADCMTPDVEAFDCGYVKGLPDPRLFRLSYLNYRWGAPSILVNDDVFVSLFADWYTSNASTYLTDGTSSGLQGAKILGEDSASILGGTLYNPVNRSGKNPLHERLFLTVSPELPDVLPNIPNPRSDFFNEMKTLVCHTRMYPVTEPKHVPAELAYEQLLKNYGAKDIFLRTHYNEFRTPIYSNAFSFSTQANLEVGGDKVLKEFYEGLSKIFPRVAPYQNNRVIHPLTTPYFNYDCLAQCSNGDIQAGWDDTYQLNHIAQRLCFRKHTPIFRDFFPWNACYLDETTNTPPWGLVDYNPFTPGAAMFRSVLLSYGNLLREVRDYYNGPVWSEGNAEFFWAGCLDTSYAQTNEPDQMPMPDFKLRKINPLENMNGYDLVKSQEEINYLLSAQIVFGNIGHIWGGKECNSILGAYTEKEYTPDAFRKILKSYYMMRQLQELYAGMPVETIQFQCGDALLTTSEMLRGKRENEGKVYTLYANGLEIWVNRNPQSHWIVNSDGTEYDLPPYGFVACLPGFFLEYSAEIDGHTADYVSGPQYTYVDGHGIPTQFPEITAANAYALIPEDDGTRRLIPVPFLAEENLDNLDARKATPLDAEANPVGNAASLELSSTGKGRIAITPQVFQWLLE